MSTLQNEIEALMIEKYRPFSCNDVALLLSIAGQPNLSKTEIQNCLERLTKNNVIFEKVYNKQKIYCARCKLEDDNSTDSTEQLNYELQLTKDKRIKLESEYNKMNVSLKELESIPSIADLQRQCDILSHELNKMSMELKSRDSVPQVSKEDMNRINKALDVAVKNWKARRAICKHMLDTLSESMNISVKELAEKVNSNIDEIIAIEKQFK